MPEKIAPTTFYIVRHGESEANAADIVGGNPKLTKKGIEQIEKVAKELAHIHFDAVYSSDFIRAHHTAQIIIANKNINVVSHVFLRERSYGDKEGMTGREYKQMLRDLYPIFDRLSHDGKMKFRYYDTYENSQEMMTRFIIFLKKLAIRHRGKTVLIGSHGSMMRVFLICLGFADWNELPSNNIKNGGYIKLVADGENFIVEEVKRIELEKGKEIKEV